MPSRLPQHEAGQASICTRYRQGSTPKYTNKMALPDAERLILATAAALAAKICVQGEEQIMGLSFYLLGERVAE